MGAEHLQVQARKFYSQRNMYLCGFTLFLSLILNRTYSLIIDVLRLEDKIKDLQERGVGKGGKGGKNEEELRKLLEKKERELEVVKKQAEGLSREYGDLSDKYAKAIGEDGKGKKDL